MSAIKLINANEGRRDVLASDRTTVYTDGYKNLFTSSTTPSIADILAGIGSDPAGTVPLSNIHVPGTDDLMVYVNGQLLPEEGPGNDYQEVGNQKILLSAYWQGVLSASTNPKLKIIWNRPLPGARDQEFNNLKDITPAVSDATLDPSTLRPTPADATHIFPALTSNELGALHDTSTLRVASATAANPLITKADRWDGTQAFHVAFVGHSVPPGSFAVPVKISAGAAVVFDLGSNWDAGNTRFVVPVSGIYQIAGLIESPALAGTGELQAYVYVNGAAAAGGTVGPIAGTGAVLSLAVGLLQLTAGQLVELYGATSSGSAETVSGRLEGYRVA